MSKHDYPPTKIINDAKESANEDAEKILTTAKEQIRNEKLKAITELKNEVANLSIEMAEKILKSELSDKKAQSEMIENFEAKRLKLTNEKR